MLLKARGTAAEMSLKHVEFREGLMEDLPGDGWADVAISDGVINLRADKKRIFSEIGRVLRPGGRIQFADGGASGEGNAREFDVHGFPSLAWKTG